MDNSLNLQVLQQPLDNLTDIKTYHDKLINDIRWEDIGLVIDESKSNVVVLLMTQDHAQALLRFNLTPAQYKDGLEIFTAGKKNIDFRSYQGVFLNNEDISSLNKMNDVWHQSKDQSVIVDIDNIPSLLTSYWTKDKDKGRGPDFTIDTKRAVRDASFGRCMFEGCGENLEIDATTGEYGNYAYLAHNIAASENGPRGNIFSKVISNDPNNILHLCDKHHRLIDKVALADYPASLLSKMRAEHIRLANNLLDGLRYPACKAFSVLWPVRGNINDGPSYQQVYSCLSSIKMRLAGNISEISKNNEILMNSTNNHYWPILIESVEVTAREIIAQCKFDNDPACIFPIGPMPALIALGAILGNKKLFIPVLRERETSQWTITKENKDPEFFKISGLDELSSDENDVIISFNFTASPNYFSLEGKRLKFKEITITANEIGNSCMKDISQFNYFMDKMIKLLHHLKSSCNTNTVHIFPCMSNMASITLGMSIDAYHPNIKIYDFYVDNNGGGEGMKSRIDINVNGTSVCLSSSN